MLGFLPTTGVTIALNIALRKSKKPSDTPSFDLNQKFGLRKKEEVHSILSVKTSLFIFPARVAKTLFCNGLV